MSGQRYEYHLGYEATKAYQAEMREATTQDRLARQALSTGQRSMPSRLAALLRDARMRLWIMKLGQSVSTETPTPR